MEIQQTPTFSKKAKKLHADQRKELEQAIHAIIASPETGTLKKGDLSGIYVYKFKMAGHFTLLAYQYNTHQLILVALGSHENFYRDLKKD